jgi:multiple sugar transport system substrate-binding protein
MKKILWLLISFMVIIAGCSKNSNDNTTAQSSDKQDKTVKEKNVINVVYQDDFTTKKWFNYIKKAYEEAHPDTTVNMIVVSGLPQSYYSKLQMMLKSDSSIDVIYEDTFMLYSDIKAGLISPVNEIKKWDEWNNFYPRLREFATSDGNVYGVPMSTDVRALFYNTEIFKKAGIKTPWQPKNWQDILDACRNIKKNVPDVTPITMPLSQALGEATTMTTLEMLLYGTSSPMIKDNKWLLASTGMLNSLKFIQTLAKEKLIPRMGIVMNPQYNSIIQDEMSPKQEIGIILEGCWITGRWVKSHPEVLKEYLPAMMPTENGQKPGYVTLSGGWLLCVNQLSKNKEEALDFIKFALNKKNVLEYVLTVNNLAVREDVALEPQYPSYLKAPTDMLKYAEFRPTSEQYPIVSSKMAIAVESVVTNSQTPKQAIQTLIDSTIRALDENSVEK